MKTKQILPRSADISIFFPIPIQFVCVRVMDPQQNLEKCILAFKDNCYHAYIQCGDTGEIGEHTGKVGTLLRIVRTHGESDVNSDEHHLEE